jgi:hypothetical protein
MEGTRKRVRSRKRGRDEFGEDLNIMGMQNRQTMATDHREWSKILLEAKVHNRM